MKAGVFRRAPAFHGLYPKSKPPAMRVVLMCIEERPGGNIARPNSVKSLPNPLFLPWQTIIFAHQGSAFSRHLECACINAFVP